MLPADQSVSMRAKCIFIEGMKWETDLKVTQQWRFLQLMFRHDFQLKVFLRGNQLINHDKNIDIHLIQSQLLKHSTKTKLKLMNYVEGCQIGKINIFQ